MLALRSGRDSYATTAAYTVRASISKTGMPIITTSNHYSYTLNTAMRVWMRVADDAFAKSEFRSSLGLSVLQPQGPLALLQVCEQLELSLGHLHCNFDVASYVCARVRRVHHARWEACSPCYSTNTREQSHSHTWAYVVLASNVAQSTIVLTRQADLPQNQVTAALALESPVEYRHWLLAYARRLGEDAEAGRLRELFEELLSPTSLPVRRDEPAAGATSATPATGPTTAEPSILVRMNCRVRGVSSSRSWN